MLLCEVLEAGILVWVKIDAKKKFSYLTEFLMQFCQQVLKDFI